MMAPGDRLRAIETAFHELSERERKYAFDWLFKTTVEFVPDDVWHLVLKEAKDAALATRPAPRSGKDAAAGSDQ